MRGLDLDRLARPCDRRFRVSGRFGIARQRQRPARAARLTPRGSLVGLGPVLGRELGDLLLLGLDEHGEARIGQQRRLRHPSQEEGLEFGPHGGIELQLGIRRESPLDLEESAESRVGIGGAARRRLCEREVRERLGLQRRALEQAEGGDPQIVDGIGKPLLRVGRLAGAQPRLVEFVTPRRGDRCHHRHRDKESELAQLLQRLAPSLREAFSTDRSPLERIGFGALLVFIAVVPLPRGAVLPEGRLLIEMSAFLIGTATFLSRARTRDAGTPKVPLFALAALAVLGAVQLVPLPPDVLNIVSPVSGKIYHETAEILALFGRNPGPTPRISIAPAETVNAIRLILAYLLLFLAAERLLSSRARRRVFEAVFLGSAMLHVAIAASLQIGEARLHGSFSNPDHFGAELEIALAVAFGALWAEVLLNADRARSATDRAERFESRLLPLAVRILAWGAIAVGIGLTQSRGAVAATALTTAFLFVVAGTHPRTRAHGRRLLRGALALAAGMILVAAVAGRAPLARFIASDAREFRGGTRLDIWRTSVEAWKEFPWVGSGLGSFADAFRRVQPREMAFLVEQAHSDPLQLLVTGGAVGGLFGALLYGSLFVILWRRWRAQRHREESAVVLAGIGALLSLTLHGLVEYNMSIPAIPATLACVLAMAMAAGAASNTVRVALRREAVRAPGSPGSRARDPGL